MGVLHMQSSPVVASCAYSIAFDPQVIKNLETLKRQIEDITPACEDYEDRSCISISALVNNLLRDEFSRISNHYNSRDSYVPLKSWMWRRLEPKKFITSV